MTLGLSVNGRQAYEPTTKIVNEITTALTQPNINIVGVYGSGDATKHIVMQQITRRVQRDGVFDVILMASIMKKNTFWSRWTKSPDVRRIQDELGNMLGLQLQDKTLKERANQLCDWIKMKDKILIILMPIWGGIDLGKIGIPLGNHHKGCKILLVAESEEFEEYATLVGQLCLTFFGKCTVNKIKDKCHKRQDVFIISYQGLSVNGHEVSESMTSVLDQILMALTTKYYHIWGMDLEMPERKRGGENHEESSEGQAV
ncbi:hypothetical protein Fmac_004546 [Flemingia macrophylla]|uniref:NB-ARC domain-containing protein n=1 Tax=Flemingia macrophylla TaxID=520843 RepID=A0ABD1N5W4_9FABA